jgi:hypothetical protein
VFDRKPLLAWLPTVESITSPGTDRRGIMKNLSKLLVIAAVIAVVVKLLEQQKQQWTGLTELEARAKLEAKLPDKIPAEKRAEVTDKIIEAMKEKGALASNGQEADPTA